MRVGKVRSVMSRNSEIVCRIKVVFWYSCRFSTLAGNLLICTPFPIKGVHIQQKCVGFVYLFKKQVCFIFIFPNHLLAILFVVLTCCLRACISLLFGCFCDPIFLVYTANQSPFQEGESHNCVLTNANLLACLFLLK